MRYALLDKQNIITEIKEYTQEQFDALTVVAQADLYPINDTLYPDAAIGWTRQKGNAYHSPSRVLEDSYDADPAAYIEHKCKESDFLLLVRFNLGFQFPIDGKWYRADIKSQLWGTSYLQAIAAGKMTSPVNWISMDNSVSQFTTEEFVQLTDYFMYWAKTVTFDFFESKTQMRAANSFEEVHTIFDPIYASCHPVPGHPFEGQPQSYYMNVSNVTSPTTPDVADVVDPFNIQTVN